MLTTGTYGHLDVEVMFAGRDVHEGLHRDRDFRVAISPRAQRAEQRRLAATMPDGPSEIAYTREAGRLREICEVELPGAQGNECEFAVGSFSFGDGEAQVRINDPATVYHVTVVRDGATVVDGDVEPTWDSVPGCGMSDGHEGSGVLPVLPTGA